MWSLIFITAMKINLSNGPTDEKKKSWSRCTLIKSSSTQFHKRFDITYIQKIFYTVQIHIWYRCDIKVHWLNDVGDEAYSIQICVAIAPHIQ